MIRTFPDSSGIHEMASDRRGIGALDEAVIHVTADVRRLAGAAIDWLARRLGRIAVALIGEARFGPRAARFSASTISTLGRAATSNI
jgi:hypothetical protein